jgi:hypothetical protein
LPSLTGTGIETWVGASEPTVGAHVRRARSVLARLPRKSRGSGRGALVFEATGSVAALEKPPNGKKPAATPHRPGNRNVRPRTSTTLRRIMATISAITLAGEIVDNMKARIKVTWKMSFNANEVRSGTVYIYEVYLQNVDGVGDPDVRRRRIARGSDLATGNPIDREITALVDRTFLDEDPPLLVLLETTDEWRAEVHLTPFAPTGTSAKSGDQLRKEFGLS